MFPSTGALSFLSSFFLGLLSRSGLFQFLTFWRRLASTSCLILASSVMRRFPL